VKIIRPAWQVTGDLAGGAIFSDDGRYRYLLRRRLGDAPLEAAWVLLNPSTAGADADDPTVRRLAAFSRREGAGSMAVVNLFALCSADPAALLADPSPAGPLNDAAIAAAVNGRTPRIIICGWGAFPDRAALRGRIGQVRALLAASPWPVRCLGLTAGGQPVHPLYQPAWAPLAGFDLTPPPPRPRTRTLAEREQLAVATRTCPRCHTPRPDACRAIRPGQQPMNRPHPQRTALIPAEEPA